MVYGRHIERESFLFMCLFFFVLSLFGQATSNSAYSASLGSAQLHALVQEALLYQNVFIANVRLQVPKNVHKTMFYSKTEDVDESALRLRFFHVAVPVVFVGVLLYCSSDQVQYCVDTKCLDFFTFLKKFVSPDGTSAALTPVADRSYVSYLSTFFFGSAKALFSFGGGRLAAMLFCGYHLYSLYSRVQLAYKAVAWLKKYFDYVADFLSIIYKIASLVGFDKGLSNDFSIGQIHMECFVKLKRLRSLLQRVPHDNAIKMYKWFFSGQARKMQELMLDVQKELEGIGAALVLLDTQLSG